MHLFSQTPVPLSAATVSLWLTMLFHTCRPTLTPTCTKQSIHFKDRPSTPQVPSPALSRSSSTAGVAGGDHLRHKTSARFIRMGTSEDSYEMAKTLDCTRLSPVQSKGSGTTPPLLSRVMSSPVPPSDPAETPASLPSVPEEVHVLTPRPFTASALPTKRVLAVSDLATRPGETSTAVLKEHAWSHT